MIRFPPSVLPIVTVSCLAACTMVPESGKDVTIDIAHTAPAYVTVAGVQRTGTEDVIQGEAALPTTHRVVGFTGGVEAKIDIPGQPPLTFRDIKVVPRPRPRKLGGEAYFTIHTGRILPRGTVVRLVFRNG